MICAIINEKYGNSDKLLKRLQNLFGSELVKKWLKNAEHNDVLTGTLFSEVANIFTHPTEFPNYKKIYEVEGILTFLRDRRETIRDFLDDIRRFRNKIAHHRPLSPVQVDLLDQYYEQIVIPVQTMFDHSYTKVNPSEFMDANSEEIDAYLFNIKEELTSLNALMSEVGKNVSTIKVETEGLRERTLNMQSLLELLVSKTAIILPSIVVIIALGAGVAWFESGSSREVSADPRQQLQKLGVSWNYDNFIRSMQEKDKTAETYFIEGGMKFQCRDFSITHECSSFYIYLATWFDKDIAALILKHNTFDPSFCIKPPENDKNIHYYSAMKEPFYYVDFYRDQVAPNPEKVAFVRALCNTPENILKFKTLIKDMQLYPGEGYWSASQKAEFANLIERWKAVGIMISGDKDLWNQT